MSGITEAEILDALRDAQSRQNPADDGAMTITEMVQAIGRCERVVRKQVTHLLREGRMVACRSARVRIDGASARVPAYRLVKDQGPE